VVTKEVLAHLYVFRSNGELVLSYHGENSSIDPALAAGFFSAIQDFARGMLNEDVSLREVNFDRYRIIFLSDVETDLIISVVVNPIYSQIGREIAKKVLEQLKNNPQSNELKISDELILGKKPFRIVVELTDRGKVLPFQGFEAELIKLCDGSRSVEEICEKLGKPFDEIIKILSKLQEENIIRFRKIIL